MNERSRWITLASTLVALSIFRIGIAVVEGTSEQYISGGITTIALWIFAGMCIWLVRHDAHAVPQKPARIIELRDHHEETGVKSDAGGGWR